MNSKQRAYLRGLAMKLQPIVTIGKNGITDSVVAELEVALEAHELIKVAVLNNADFSAKEVAEEVARKSRSETVQTLGSKITLYRVSHKDNIKHIILPR